MGRRARVLGPPTPAETRRALPDAQGAGPTLGIDPAPPAFQVTRFSLGPKADGHLREAAALIFSS